MKGIFLIVCLHLHLAYCNNSNNNNSEHGLTNSKPSNYTITKFLVRTTNASDLPKLQLQEASEIVKLNVDNSTDSPNANGSGEKTLRRKITPTNNFIVNNTSPQQAVKANKLPEHNSVAIDANATTTAAAKVTITNVSHDHIKSHESINLAKKANKNNSTNDHDQKSLPNIAIPIVNVNRTEQPPLHGNITTDGHLISATEKKNNITAKEHAVTNNATTTITTTSTTSATTSSTTTTTTSTTTMSTTTTTTTTPKPKKPLVTYGVEDFPDLDANVLALNRSHIRNSKFPFPEMDAIHEMPNAQPSREHLSSFPFHKNRDYIVPIVAIIFAVPLSMCIVITIYRRVRDFWSTRHYRRMDFLVDGMYND